jgi:hypothetical protein
MYGNRRMLTRIIDFLTTMLKPSGLVLNPKFQNETRSQEVDKA